MQGTMETEVTITIKANVEYEATGPVRGIRERFGVPLEPDEDASVEILRVIDSKTGKVIDLDAIEEHERGALQELAMEHACGE